MANPKRPRDPNQRAKLIVDIVTGESNEPKAPPPKNPAAVELGRRGGWRSRSIPLGQLAVDPLGRPHPGPKGGPWSARSPFVRGIAFCCSSR